MTYLLIPLFAILNRARGSQLFGLTDSTTIGRLVATFGMAFTIALIDIPHALHTLPWAWATLFLWALPAWDKYWSAEIGNDPNHSKLWGLVHMTLRMALIIPAIAGIAFITGNSPLWALLALFFGLPYIILGAINKSIAVEWSEYAIGGVLGFLIMKAIGQ